MFSDRAYHDTYYVVAHSHYALSMVVILIAVLAAWWAVLRMAKSPPRRLAFWTIAAFVLGAFLSFGPIALLMIDIAKPESFVRANQVASAGGLLSAAATLVTAITFVRTGIAALINRG